MREVNLQQTAFIESSFVSEPHLIRLITSNGCSLGALILAVSQTQSIRALYGIRGPRILHNWLAAQLSPGRGSRGFPQSVICKFSPCVCWQAIKYGVVSTSALLRDLWNWDSFYVAGRLHKPVLFLVRDAAVDRAVAANIDAALAAALLLLPPRFTAKVCQSPIRCVRLPSECTD